MRGKSGMLMVSGAGALLLGAIWFMQGCVFPIGTGCACDEMYMWKEVTILDEQGNPVDSALITVVRTADGKALTVPEHNLITKKGNTVIFDDGITRQIPDGKTEMQIRVTASKEGKSGEELFVVGITECRCHFEVKSGRDTLVIR
ncbi:MAG: hypothetical protein JWO30_1545 [Fibrobacteres bacterium]|nr:hypothetical protein [Fibrobacterota bacterium]